MYHYKNGGDSQEGMFDISDADADVASNAGLPLVTVEIDEFLVVYIYNNSVRRIDLASVHQYSLMQSIQVHIS